MGTSDELDEEEDSDSIGFLADPETVGMYYKGNTRTRVRTDSSFSRRVRSALEKLIGWLPGNLATKVRRNSFRRVWRPLAKGLYRNESMLHRVSTGEGDWEVPFALHVT